MDTELLRARNWAVQDVAFSLPVETVSEDHYQAMVECLVLYRFEIYDPAGDSVTVERVTNLNIELPDAASAQSIRRSILMHHTFYGRLRLLRTWHEVQSIEGRPVRNLRILEVFDEGFSPLNPIAVTDTSVTGTQGEDDLVVWWGVEVSYEMEGEPHQGFFQVWGYTDRAR
jgi:hypothetical protein